MWSIVTDPDQFFRRRNDEERLWPGTIILLCSSVIGAAGTIAVTLHTAQVLPSGVRSVATFGALIGVVISGLLPLTLWGGFSTVLHLSSAWFSDADGEFRTTVRLTAWGFFPYLLTVSVSTGVLLVVIFTTPLPTDAANLATYAQSVRQNPLFLLVDIVRFVCAIWSGFLWAFAVKHARNVTVRQGVFAAVGPTLMLLFLAVWNSSYLAL